MAPMGIIPAPTMSFVGAAYMPPLLALRLANPLKIGLLKETENSTKTASKPLFDDAPEAAVGPGEVLRHKPHGTDGLQPAVSGELAH